MPDHRPPSANKRLQWGALSCSRSAGIIGRLNPSVAYLCRGKTRKSAPDVAAHRLGLAEAYFTVGEVLFEARTAVDGVLSRKRSGFYRYR